MKVLIIITKGDIGGAQIYVLNLARTLKSHNIQVNIGIGQDGQFLKNELDKIKVNYTNFNSLKRTNNPFYNLLFIFELKSFLAKNNFDAVHFNSTNALFGAIGAKLVRRKIKTIFTIHGLSVLDPNYQKNKLLKIIYKFLFKFLFLFIDEKIFVCNSNLELAKKNKLVKKANIIYNGLDPTQIKFEPKEKVRNYLSQFVKQNLDNKFILGSIGRLAYQKNYEFLINIFPQILKIKPNAILIIMGEGKERKKYESLIKKLKLENKVFLIGEIKNASQYIKAFSLFTLPSRFEGLSITLVEMLFAGLPALISNVGGNAEVLYNSKYQLYKLDDKQDFLANFKKIINNKSLYAKLAENNLEQSSEFILENSLKQYLSILKS